MSSTTLISRPRLPLRLPCALAVKVVPYPAPSDWPSGNCSNEPDGNRLLVPAREVVISACSLVTEVPKVSTFPSTVVVRVVSCCTA
ncbi:hypothetical protein D3C73_814070 [compost metagenome]